MNRSPQALYLWASPLRRDSPFTLPGGLSRVPHPRTACLQPTLSYRDRRRATEQQSDRFQDTLIHISPEILDVATEAELDQIAKGRVSDQLIARLEQRYFEGKRSFPVA